MGDTLNFARSFCQTGRLVMVVGTYQKDIDNWTLVAQVNGKVVDTRQSFSPYDDATDMLEAWGRGNWPRCLVP